MDNNAIIDQMNIFVQSLQQINEVLPILYKNNNNDNEPNNMTTIKELMNSKLDLMHTLVMLNIMRYKEHYVHNQIEHIYPGSFILAPRFFHNTMCFDFAIVIKTIDNHIDTTLLEETGIDIGNSYIFNDRYNVTSY